MKFLISAILVFFFITSCQKEFGYGDNRSLATLSLASPSGSCTNAVVNGTYTVGTSLTAVHTIGIKVIVGSIGSYSLRTNTVNGISFSASGIFSSIGEQTINLIGSGTPITDGNFNFTIGNNGCSFSITASPKSRGTAVFTYDGAPNSCTNISVGGMYSVGMPLTNLNRVKIDVNVNVTGTYSITTALINGFLFSGSGNLETMGYGTVILQGTGTPVAIGRFVFIPSNNGCPFLITVNP